MQTVSRNSEDFIVEQNFFHVDDVGSIKKSSVGFFDINN